MNVKIKARVAILKSYMTLLGFKDPKVTARIHALGGAPITFRGKEEIELDHLGEASNHHQFSFATEVVITPQGSPQGPEQRPSGEQVSTIGVHRWRS